MIFIPEICVIISSLAIWYLYSAEHNDASIYRIAISRTEPPIIHDDGHSSSGHRQQIWPSNRRHWPYSIDSRSSSFPSRQESNPYRQEHLLRFILVSLINRSTRWIRQEIFLKRSFPWLSQAISAARPLYSSFLPAGSPPPCLSVVTVALITFMGINT